MADIQTAPPFHPRCRCTMGIAELPSTIRSKVEPIQTQPKLKPPKVIKKGEK